MALSLARSPGNTGRKRLQRRQFLEDISHELRRPLTVIRGMAEVALRGEEKPLTEFKATLEHIVQLTTQANHLVEDLLFMARFKSGSLQIDKRPTSLSEIMTEVSQQGNILAGRKLITLTLQCEKDVGFVQGDPQRLIQLFMIIIENAVNYTEPGGAIGIHLAKDGDHGKVVITDTGIGIPAADLNHVFERCYRVKQTGARAQPGAGLGLPIATWITEAHEGQIGLASEPGAGTTVEILLPLARKVRSVHAPSPR